MSLENNTVELQAILDTVNTLPETSGKVESCTVTFNHTINVDNFDFFDFCADVYTINGDVNISDLENADGLFTTHSFTDEPISVTVPKNSIIFVTVCGTNFDGDEHRFDSVEDGNAVFLAYGMLLHEGRNIPVDNVQAYYILDDCAITFVE